MKTYLSIFLFIICFPWTSYPQGWETLGKGVIDFLRTNPKTASRMKANEAAALDVISDVLRTSANRKHDMNVANAGRSEIVINTGGNNQATIYSDIEGNVYLLYNGTIYPISKNLVDQAKNEYSNPANESGNLTIKNATLPNYNLTALKNEYKYEKETTYVEENDWNRYYLRESKESVSDIASRFNVSTTDIYFRPYKFDKEKTLYHPSKYTILDLKNILYPTDKNGIFQYRRMKVNNYVSSQNKLKKTSLGCEPLPGLLFSFPGYNGNKSADGYEIYIHIYKKKPKSFYRFEIVTLFTCNWAKDFDGEDLNFDDFQGIKRSFDMDEILTFIMGYTSETTGTWKLEVYEMSTGKQVFIKTGITDPGGRIICQDKGNDKLHPGVYVYNFTLKSSGNEKISRSEKFEILEASN